MSFAVGIDAFIHFGILAHEIAFYSGKDTRRWQRAWNQNDSPFQVFLAADDETPLKQTGNSRPPAPACGGQTGLSVTGRVFAKKIKYRQRGIRRRTPG